MAAISNFIRLTQTQYNTLMNGGSITKGGVTYTYDSDAVYLVENNLLEDKAYEELASNDWSVDTTNKRLTISNIGYIVDVYQPFKILITFNNTDTTTLVLLWDWSDSSSAGPGNYEIVLRPSGQMVQTPSIYELDLGYGISSQYLTLQWPSSPGTGHTVGDIASVTIEYNVANIQINALVEV